MFRGEEREIDKSMYIYDVHLYKTNVKKAIQESKISNQDSYSGNREKLKESIRKKKNVKDS